MHNRTRPFLPARHPEMVLMAVKISEKNETRFIEVRRVAEKVARERQGRSEYPLEARKISLVNRANGSRGKFRQRIEDSEQRVAEAMIVASNQNVIVEIVTCTCARLAGAAAASRSRTRIEQRDLNAIDFRPVLLNDLEASLHGVWHLARPSSRRARDRTLRPAMQNDRETGRRTLP